MQVAAGLLASLGDTIDKIEAHLASMEIATLDEMLRALPSKSHVTSAERLMRILVISEMEKRGSHIHALHPAGRRARLH